MKEVPVIWAKDLTEEQVKAFRIMDNKSSEYAYWNIDLLKEESIKLLSNSKKDLIKEVEALRKRKTYGLVWEEDKTKEEDNFLTKFLNKMRFW